ncbi:MAG: 23S rRNA (uracil(1939)-C(5))-methyltransferase RlmD [Oscillospiraceae bacterium]|nr:23S rRNA (uracil(1939)-C(5))-methyltransferase RlmD [Oscillospiraceae bacterium]
MKKNDIYTVTIEDYSSDASGICRINGRVVFVPKAIPGEEWEIKIVKVRHDCAYARGERLLKASPARIVSACPYFGLCGGCDTQHISYEEELRFKLGLVNSALRRIGKQSMQATEIIGSENISHYRNKGIFAIGTIDGKARCGFFRERSHQLIAVDDCLIQDELSCRAAIAVTEFMNANGISPYDEAAGTGAVRHVFCRRSVHGSDVLLCIVSREGLGKKTQAFIDCLRKACPELTGIVLNINRSTGNTVLSGDFYTLWGRGSINDTLCGFKFDIAPQAFFQVNPPQAERLYARAIEYAALTPDMLALDLYCGAGTISLCLSAHAKKVIGAEIVPEAVDNANKNALANNVANVEFILADAGQAAKALYERGERPDVVVVDPPRKGLLENAIEAVAAMQPQRIVYVSCDPATLARDILRFNAYSYTLEKVTAVDMFPRTRHVETVCQLVLRNPVTHINIDVDVEELVQDKRGAATYGQIKDYVLEHSGLKVSSLYIAQVKQKCDIIERENYNKSKSEDAKQPQCPPEKEVAIMEALRYYGMIK